MAGTSASIAKANKRARENSIYDYVWLLYSGQTLAAIYGQMGVHRVTVNRWNDTIRSRADRRPDEAVIEHSGITWEDARRMVQKALQHERDVQATLSLFPHAGGKR